VSDAGPEMMTRETTVAVVGLGYVGLPLAVEFGKHFPTIGFDLSVAKVDAYRKGSEPTGEVSTADLLSARHLVVTADPALLKQAEFVIVAVPTPVDDAHQPDSSRALRSVQKAGGSGHVSQAPTASSTTRVN
jgi:UDP-N-acetyl-D-galactosamine dehydrogenase